MVFDYVAGLVRAGHEVTVAAPRGSNRPRGARLLETVTLPEDQDRDDLADFVATREYNTGGYDAIHDFSHRGTFHKRMYPAIHMVWDPVSVRYDFKPDNRAVCVSQWQAGRYAQMYGRSAVVGKTGFIDTSVYHPYPEGRGDRFLFLGKLSPEKGPDLAIEYAQELDVPLDVVGGLIPSESRMENAYLAGLRSKCVGSRWKLHFNVEEEYKVDFLRDARCVIYPVRQEEAHWLAGIEAWCMDTPTIVADRGAMREVAPVVRGSKEFFLETMKTVEEIQPKDASWLVSKWGAKAREEYSVEACVRYYVELLEKVSRGASW